MARKKNNGQGAGPINPEGATAGHNVAAINARINDGFKQLYDYDTAIEAAKDAHVRPLAKDRTKEMRNLKADTGIDGKDLKLQYALYRRQEDAKALDEEDRNRILDNMRTVFGAMKAGETLDFLDVLDGGHVPQRAADEEAARDQEAAAASGRAH